MKNNTNIIGYGLIIFSLFILANPNISLFDFLPDLIAYLLIYLALGKVSNVIPHFDDARESMLKLFWVSLSKLPAFFIMLSISSMHQAERSAIAVFSLVYAIIELIYIFPAFSSLFNGFFYLEARFTENVSSIKIPTKITYTFFTVKMLCCCVPEMSLISVSDRLGIVSAFQINIANYYPWFAVLAAFITLIFGIIWIIKIIKYVKSLSSNIQIERELANVYGAKREQIQGLFNHRYVSISLSLFFLGVILSTDLIFDNVNILPDFFSTVSIIFSLLLMYKYTSRIKLAIPIGIAYAFSSVLSSYFLTAFQGDYSYSDIERIEAAKKSYSIVTTSSVLECALSILFFFACAYALIEFLKKTTGYASDKENALSYNSDLHKSFARRAYISAIIGSISTVLSAVYVFLLSYTEKVKIRPEYSQSEVYMASYGWFWIIPVIASIVWIVYTYNLVSVAKEESERKNII